MPRTQRIAVVDTVTSRDYRDTLCRSETGHYFIRVLWRERGGRQTRISRDRVMVTPEKALDLCRISNNPNALR